MGFRKAHVYTSNSILSWDLSSTLDICGLSFRVDGCCRSCPLPSFLVRRLLVSCYSLGARCGFVRVLTLTVLVWGIILITTPACTNFAGVATNRFLLGTFEAVVNPGFVLIMGKKNPLSSLSDSF